MIKPVKTQKKLEVIRPIEISTEDAIKYIGQSGTSGYASAAKGYIAKFVLCGTNITWEPLVFDNSSNDKRYYVDALAESVINKKYEKYNTVIIHSTPDLWPSYLRSHKNINNIEGYCTWETNKLPPKWVECINQVNIVNVPSTFNKISFKDSGVTSDIRVVPHVWHYQPLFEKENITVYDYTRKKIPKNKYTYYCIGELNFRKGIEDTVKVFDRINSKYRDTQLVLKIHYKEYTDINKKYCIDRIKGITSKLGTDIYLILDNITNDELRALHSFGDCYVSLNKGEGFGLTIYDAFKYGKQLVTTGYGGQLEYLGDNHVGLVEIKINNVTGMSQFSTNYSYDQMWAYPDLDSAYHKMISCYETKI